MVAVHFPEVHRIVADADLDGLCAAAILQRALPGTEVIFAHPALVRSGHLDDVIDRKTVIVDLPFHPSCGWYVDHHLTNRPDEATANAFLAAGGRWIGPQNRLLQGWRTTLWPLSVIWRIWPR